LYTGLGVYSNGDFAFDFVFEKNTKKTDSLFLWSFQF